jgi:hypothetical protein
MIATMPTVASRGGHPTVALAMLEARRSLRSVWLWVGVAASTWFVVSAGDGAWQADTYHRLQAASMPIALAILVIGLNAGGRDRHHDRPPLAEDAALDADDRAAGRLLGTAAPCAVGALWAAAVFAYVRAEGGMWVGDEPGRTDAATYSVAEMLQPLLLFAVAAAAGIALGRACRHRVPLIVGALGFSLFGMVSWAFQSSPMRYVTPIQTQPIQVHIGAASLDPLTLPADWLLSRPDQYEPDWARVIVHVPMAAWHDVYLVGLVLLGAGFAVRRRRGSWLVAAGVVAVLAGIVAQVLVAPAAIDLAPVVG